MHRFLPLLLISVSLWADASSDRPNIIFLLTDDQRADTLTSYGSKTSQTPSLDKLANEGVLFENAFVTDPTCKPSRVSFLTGQYERVHRVGFSSRESLREEQWKKTYPALLRESGYYTGFIGKFGVEQYTFKGKTDQKFDFWYAHDGWGKFWLQYKPRPHLDIYQNDPAEIVTEIMTNGVKKFLTERDQSKPFCLSVSYSAPHGSISSTMHGPSNMSQASNQHPHLKDHKTYGDLYRDLNIQLPKTYTQNPAEYLPTEILDPNKGRDKTYNYDQSGPEHCLEHHFRYAQLVHGIDNSVSEIVKMLESEGLTGNTIIIFSSDHGLLLGDYGIGGKGLLYDLVSKVPLIIYDPRLASEQRGQRIEQQVRSVDVAPTILRLAGIATPRSMNGVDLMPLITDKSIKDSWSEDLFVENLYIGRDGPYSEAIRRKGWKYIRYFRPSQLDENSQYRGVPDFSELQPRHEQLFDLNQDSGETKNLASNPEYQQILKELRASCTLHSKALTQHSKKFNPLPPTTKR